MFENIGSFFKKIMKPEQKELLVEPTSKDAAKERLHIVLMQDRANVSADFLELMKQEIIDVIKKYIVIDEEQIDVRLTNQENGDGTTGVPALYANIPIINIRNDLKGEYLNQGNKEKTKLDYNTNLSSVNIDENSVAIDKKSNAESVVNSNAEKDISLQDVNESEKLEDSKKINISNFNEEKQTDEEEDDDVTFDDLLKAAEEEEKLNQVQNETRVKENEDITENKVENEKPKETPLPKSVKKSNRTSKKNTQKSGKKKSNKSNKK